MSGTPGGRRTPEYGQSQQSVYQDSQDGMGISATSRPSAIKVLDTVEVKINVDGSETWEQYIVYDVETTDKCAAAGVRDLDDQQFTTGDFETGDIRLAAAPAADKDKLVAVFARVELAWRTGEWHTWERPLRIGDYKFVHTYDESRPRPRDFRCFKKDATKSDQSFCKGLKTLAEHLFSGDLLEKAKAIARGGEPRESLEPGPSPAGGATEAAEGGLACGRCGRPCGNAGALARHTAVCTGQAAGGATPVPAPMAPMTQEEVERLRTEAGAAETKAVQRHGQLTTEEEEFDKKLVTVHGVAKQQLCESWVATHKRGREEVASLEAEGKKKRAKAGVAHQLLEVEKQVQADKQKIAEKKEELKLLEQEETRHEAEAKALRERFAAA